MVDEIDGLFGDWCELNFVDGVPPEALPLLRRDYSAMQSLEERVARSVAGPIAGGSAAAVGTWREKRASPLATVFIPSVLDAFAGFWGEWLR